MKKIMFYCQNLMGMGHLVRSTEIIRSLVKEFEVWLIEGGTSIQNFEIPSEVKIISMPPLRISNKSLETVDSSLNLEEVKASRQSQLLKIFEEFQPDCFITEGYPFSKGKMAFELIPLLEKVKSTQGRTKTVCCVRDIIMSKDSFYQDRENKEIKKRDIINRFYDMLLIHSDPKIHRLESDFSRMDQLNCRVHYTGYVAQSPPENLTPTSEDLASLNSREPMIVVSIGGGRFGHELIETVLEASPILARFLPHKIQIFAGPLIPEAKFLELQTKAAGKSNINLRKYTAHLLDYMDKAALSISLGGYNTTMNVLRTGVNAMIFPSNDGDEQRIRAEKLEKLGIIQIINSSDLKSDRLAEKIITTLHLKTSSQKLNGYGFELQGAQKTTEFIKDLLEDKSTPVSLPQVS